MFSPSMLILPTPSPAAKAGVLMVGRNGANATACLIVQLEIVSAGEIVHVVSDATAPLRALKRRKAIVVCHTAFAH